MKLPLRIVAVTLSLAGIASAVGAREKPAAPSGLRAVQLDCFKQYGGYQDPQTKKWKMEGNLNGMQATIDAIYSCVAQKTGKPAAPFLSQSTYYR